MDRKQFTFEVKELDDAGRFAGYAAVFGNVDLVGDVIEPGAFKEFHANKAGAIKVLYQHDQAAPIGSATVSQDDKGLRVEGKLVLADPQARVVHAHLKEGTLDALSIGYDVLPGGEKFSELGFRRLIALKLWEVSIVTFGANPLATVTGVKSRCGDIRAFEKWLHAQGWSKRESKILASAGFPGLIEADLADEPDFSKLLNIATSIKI